MNDLINPKCFSKEWIISKSKEFSGVPFITKGGNLMVMQVVKQLYDLGELFDIASDFEKIKIAFEATFDKENEYRNAQFTKEQALQDTIDTCLNLLQIRLKGFKNNQITDHLDEGIKRITSHLLNDNFKVDSKAKITASKVLYIANSIKNGIAINFNTDKYSEDKLPIIEAITLPKPYVRLNRLKPILPEAFYYIWKEEAVILPEILAMSATRSSFVSFVPNISVRVYISFPQGS